MARLRHDEPPIQIGPRIPRSIMDQVDARLKLARHSKNRAYGSISHLITQLLINWLQEDPNADPTSGLHQDNGQETRAELNTESSPGHAPGGNLDSADYAATPGADYSGTSFVSGNSPVGPSDDTPSTVEPLTGCSDPGGGFDSSGD